MSPNRYLVSFDPREAYHQFTDILVIGAGIAGIRAALEVPPDLHVLVLNKDRLDETVGQDSEAIEIVGKPYDLGQIKVAIHGALQRVLKVKRPRGITPPMR